MIYRSAAHVMRDIEARADGKADVWAEVVDTLSYPEVVGFWEGMGILDMAERLGEPAMSLDVPSWLLDTPGLTLAGCAVMAAAMRGSRAPLTVADIARRICRYEANLPGWPTFVVERELASLTRAGLVSQAANGAWVTND